MSSAARWRALLAEVDQAGLCAHPVRLRGFRLDGATGELIESDLRVACKDRRAAVCPSCSRLYQADAWQLVAAGIRGGKGVPQSVVGHPLIFVTLTAPSFGPVHRTDGSGERPRLCRPRRSAKGCPHGRTQSCDLRHGPDDPVVGEPLCAECFDYAGAVLWNAHVSRLWAATAHRLYREVARAGGLSTTRLRSSVRLSYLKVVEFQARGLVHLHVVLRADGGAGPSEAPPPWLEATLLCHCIAQVVGEAAVPVPSIDFTGLRRAGWGLQHDIRILLSDGERDDGPDAAAIAAYVAKYATKTADGSLDLAHRIRGRAGLEHLELRPHIKALVTTAWALGGRRELRSLRLRDHAHTFGYGGQFSSKSVRFSTTFGALRQARADHVGPKDQADPDYDGEWRYAGRGYDNPESDALAARLLEARLEMSRKVPEGSTTIAQIVP